MYYVLISNIKGGSKPLSRNLLVRKKLGRYFIRSEKFDFKKTVYLTFIQYEFLD